MFEIGESFYGFPYTGRKKSKKVRIIPDTDLFIISIPFYISTSSIISSMEDPGATIGKTLLSIGISQSMTTGVP